VEATAASMAEGRVSPPGISGTSIVYDDKNRLSYNGSEKPKWLDRMLHGRLPENEGRGSVVRVGTRVRGKDRTPEEVDETTRHELEHVAQADRHDVRVPIGSVAIWGGAAVGTWVGSKVGRRPATRIAGALLGAVIGHAAGYKVAPHERQARARAKEALTTQAPLIRRHQG